jgi:hypothetical protein
VCLGVEVRIDPRRFVGCERGFLAGRDDVSRMFPKFVDGSFVESFVSAFWVGLCAQRQYQEVYVLGCFTCFGRVVIRVKFCM